MCIVLSATYAVVQEPLHAVTVVQQHSQAMCSDDILVNGKCSMWVTCLVTTAPWTQDAFRLHVVHPEVPQC